MAREQRGSLSPHRGAHGCAGMAVLDPPLTAHPDLQASPRVPHAASALALAGPCASRQTPPLLAQPFSSPKSFPPCSTLSLEQADCEDSLIRWCSSRWTYPAPAVVCHFVPWVLGKGGDNQNQGGRDGCHPSVGASVEGNMFPVSLVR